MLSASQLEIMRRLLRLPVHHATKAWELWEVRNVCRSYDVLTGYFDVADGNEALNRLLVRPNLVSLSPDHLWCKLTDYGRALYEQTEACQREWEEAPIIGLDDAEKEQVIINAGEVFRGKVFVIQLFKRARTTLRLHDNFCAHELLEWLYSLPRNVAVQLLTSPRGFKQDPLFESLYRAYKQERPASDLRLTDDVHDRKIIVDDRDAFQIGESIKDIGRKGTTIVRLDDVAAHVAQFGRLWASGKPV